MSTSVAKKNTVEKPKKVNPFDDIDDPEKFLEKVEKEYDIKVIFASLGGSRSLQIEGEEDDYDVHFVYVFNDPALNTDLGRALSGKKAPDSIRNFNKKATIDYTGYSLDRVIKFATNKAFVYSWLVSPTIYKSVDKFEEKLLGKVDYDWLKESTISLNKFNACRPPVKKNEDPYKKRGKLVHALQAVLIADYLSITEKEEEYKNIYDLNKMLDLLIETERITDTERELIDEFLFDADDSNKETIVKIINSFCKSYEPRKGGNVHVPDTKFLKDVFSKYTGMKL